MAQQVGPRKLEVEKEEVVSTEKWPYMFPIWGQKATDRGHKLQLPYGISSQYYYSSQKLTIPTIKVAFNDGQVFDVSELVQIGDVEANVGALTFRPNFWLFPFLNLYAVFGIADGETVVPFDAITLPGQTIPLNAKSTVVNEGTSFGIGATFTGKVSDLVFIIDANHTWSKMERFDDPFPVAVLSMRFAKRFELSNGRTLTPWIGAMGQFLSADTVGKIFVNDFAPAIEGKAAEITAARDTNCQQVAGIWVPRPGSGYDAKQCLGVAALSNLANKVADTKVDYAIEKKLQAIWNLMIGANYDLSRNWSVRAEVGVIERWSAMVGFEYRFGL
jgi:hypothetical protein